LRAARAGAAHRRGFALVSASALAWSAGGLFTRLVTLDNWTMAAWRGLFGAAGLALVMLLLRERDVWGSLLRMGWLGWLYVVETALGMSFYLAALRHTTVASVAVIYATTPLLAASLSWIFFRERSARSAVFGSGLALLGVALMMGFSGNGAVLGDVLAFGMTFSMAMSTVVARHFQGIPILATSALSSLLCGLMCWPLGTPLAVGPRDLGILALFGIVNFAIGLPLFTFGARLLPAIETALIGALDAPLAPLWVWLVFGETPSAATLLGGGIVFCAVAMHLVAGRMGGR
jgi:drug/metabolite transporter (DMT)-like permease